MLIKETARSNKLGNFIVGLNQKWEAKEETLLSMPKILGCLAFKIKRKSHNHRLNHFSLYYLLTLKLKE